MASHPNHCVTIVTSSKWTPNIYKHQSLSSVVEDFCLFLLAQLSQLSQVEGTSEIIVKKFSIPENL